MRKNLHPEVPTPAQQPSSISSLLAQRQPNTTPPDHQIRPHFSPPIPPLPLRRLPCWCTIGLPSPRTPHPRPQHVFGPENYTLILNITEGPAVIYFRPNTAMTGERGLYQ
ncbi:hypothetical protein E2C01_057613 [Portunus trituberculatus]|uniref:Uncharacterized protein n=1 Tax=Portunus trituberculatus TaxID=210409 RepID=A0A5B7H1L4_PORTR|nr:hypothetical protein [Portunus trituberculatus]